MERRICHPVARRAAWKNDGSEGANELASEKHRQKIQRNLFPLSLSKECSHEEVSGILGLSGSAVSYGLGYGELAFYDNEACLASCQGRGLLR
jgi:hypothetical protein